MNRVYYHHKDDKQFSIDFVNLDLQIIEERVASYDSHVSVKVEQYTLDRDVYIVYTASGPSGAADSLEYDLVDQISSMEEANSVIATRLIDVFETVLKENYEEEGKRVEAYKDVAANDIEPALNQVDWNGTAVEVAGRLASNLILKHALPNANHRTAIGMAQLYLRRINSNFSMPDTKKRLEGDDEYDWMNWVNEYIERSKCILTVRRKGDIFRILQDFGCDVLIRKHGVEIVLEEYDLDLPRSERWSVYAEQHERLMIEFIEDAVRRAGMDELLETHGLTKHEFAARLKDLE